MQEFWHRFTTSLYWFVGTIIVCFILFLLFWNLMDPEGYTSTINSWAQSLKDLFSGILVLAITCVGLGLILKGLFKIKGH